MPARIAAFAAAQSAACFYAIRRGGEPERWTAWMMAAAAGSSALAIYDFGIPAHAISPMLFGVDAAFLVGLLCLAVRADRFWPMWVAALQLLAIAVHVVRGLDATMLPEVYNRALGKVAYPMILLLVVGTARHVARVRAGSERDWSPFRW